MTFCAAVPGALSPSRRSRKGEARLDVIVMIVVIVAVLGMGTWAFFAYSAWADDEPVVARMETAPMALRAELTSLQRMSEVASAPLGHTDVDSIQRQILSFTGSQNANPVIPAERPPYFAPSPNAVNESRDDRNSGVFVDANGKLVGVEQINDQYAQNDITTLVALINAQQVRINALVDTIELWGRVQTAESNKAKAASTAYADRAKKFVEADLVPFLDGLDTELRTALNGYVTSVNAEADAIAQTNANLAGAHDVVTAARKKLDEERQKVGPAAKAAREAQEEAWNLLSRRNQLLAANPDFSGFVEQVEPNSGYVWINLGQLDNVRREMTFQVFSPTEDGSGTVLVAEIRVKNVLGAHLSQCRIDFLKDDRVKPKIGDFVKNPNYATKAYQVYAFVGNFGGKASKFSKQQLTDILEQAGLVVRSPARDTEVVIVGEGYENDPAFRKLVEDGVTFVSRTERDILYMLGISSPD